MIDALTRAEDPMLGLGNIPGPTWVHCPRCGAALPVIRMPSSMQQGLWGGWTCAACGCKVDKYGREITP